MNRKVAPRLLAISTIAISLAVVSLGAFTLSWFMGPNIESNDNFLDGEIGLRNYFHAGDGTEEKPYEIVQPVHYYNLMRLQNLGIFPDKTYFQVGSIFDIEGIPSLRCISGFDADKNPIYTDYLDMGDFSSKNRISSIGGEGVPFVGEINGNGLPIRDLKVYGNPEDVGVFGYVAHGGSLQNLVFDNLEVTSLGYNNNTSSDEYQLFSENIDDIFSESAPVITKNMKLTLYDFNSTTEDYDETNLKKLNGATGTEITNINSDDKVIGGTKYYNGYFKPTFPDNSVNPRFTYSMISSSPFIRPVGDLGITGADKDNFTLDFTPLYESADFNSGKEYQVNAKIYLVASVKVDGHVFSRVIQSYTLEVYSNSSTYEDGEYSLSVFCDYVDQGDATDHNTGYHHGVNVGLIAGHLDGSAKNCYVYEGKLKFNDTGFHPVNAETDTALIGEVGKNVNNTIDPDLGLVVNGDIGVMNFSKIYSLIRTDTTTPHTVKAGQKTSTSGNLNNYISFKGFIQQDTIGMFEEYLRYGEGKKDEQEYITYTSTSVGAGTWHDYSIPSNIPDDFNSVDFLWNNVIEDAEDADRGLGVFKITSSYNKGAKEHPESYGVYMVDGMSSCRIINGKTPKTKVYFSTAEYDYTKENYGVSWDDTNDAPKTATDLPSYSDVLSFNYPFSRDFNYVFELDLSKMEFAGKNDYMYNTDSNFLSNYLSNKLIDKYGDPVIPGSPRFGFMFRSSENELLTSLSSYMPVGVPGSKNPYTSEGTTKYFPANSIIFSIENPNGANVSVVGNNADIGIYGYDPDVPTGGTTLMYKMKSTSTGQLDMDRYFTYDVATGATGTKTVVYAGDMKNGGALYGHIFKLPKGHYVIGSTSGTANIYFLAVQGQTDGTIGSLETITLDDKVENVDFLLSKPSFSDFGDNLDKALFSYRGVFNTTSGTITNDVYIYNDKKYMRVTFNNNPVFVASMHLKSRKIEHIFMFNGQLLDTETYDYTAV